MDGVITSGVWQLCPVKPKDRRHVGQRYNALLDRLAGLGYNGNKPDLIAYEQAHHRGGAATEYHYGIITHLQSWADRLGGVDLLPVHSATVKKLGYGHGRATKDAMLQAARDRWPEANIIDDNEADARFIALAAAVKSGGVA